MIDKSYREYMRRYDDFWRVRKGQDGVYHIVCRYAIIIPYDNQASKFLFACEFPSRRMMNFRMSKIKEVLKEDLRLTQEGHADCCFTIKNDDLNKTLRNLKPYLEVYVRKYYPNRKNAGIVSEPATDKPADSKNE